MLKDTQRKCQGKMPGGNAQRKCPEEMPGGKITQGKTDSGKKLTQGKNYSGKKCPKEMIG